MPTSKLFVETLEIYIMIEASYMANGTMVLNIHACSHGACINANCVKMIYTYDD